MGAQDVITGGAGTDKLVIVDTTKASEAGLAAATITGVEALELSTNGGVGRFSTAAGTEAGAQEVTTITPSGVAGTPVAFTKVGITINGRTYETGTLGANNTTAVHLGTEVAALLSTALGNSATISSVASTTGIVTVTSAARGQKIPDFTVTVTNGTGGVVAAAVSDTTPSKSIADTNAPSQQIVTFTVTENTLASTDAYTVHYNGLAFNVYTGDTIATALTAAVNQINTLYGKTIATVNGLVVTVLGEAGVPTPLIGITVKGNGTTDPTIATSVVRAATTTETAAVNATVYDATGFADSVTATAQGDVNLKAAKTAVVTATTTAGTVTVDGGKTVTVVATKAVTVGGADITSANVTTATTSAAVAIGATSGTTAVTPKLTTATVKGGSDVLVTDETGGTSAGTLTSVTISETADATVTLEGKALTTVNVGKQTVATNITVTNADTLDHVFTLSVADTGTSSAQVEVTNDTAKEVNLTAGGTNNNVLIDGDGSLTKMTVAGAGKLTLAIDSTTAIAAFDASAMTGDLTLSGLEAVALSVKTGSGKDSFTVVATAKQTVDSGAGNDTVTIDAAAAKGSTINLGTGDDVLLMGSSGSVAVDDTLLITSIDGGDGTDTVAASFVTSGNGNQFVNFERLGLTNSTLDASLLTTTTITGLELLVGGGTYTSVNSNQALLARTSTSGTTTLTMSNVTGAADSYSITFAGDNSAATTAPTSANFAAGTVVTAGVETINIVSGGSKAWNSITLGANGDAENVVISGAANLDIAFASGFGSVTAPATGVVNIDGSAATGKLDINLANVVEAATGYTVKGGSGADTITVADTVTTIFGGAGADTFKVALAVGDDDSITLSDLAVGDKIDFGTAGAFNATAVDVTAQTSLAGAIGVADGTDNEVSWFVYGGNTYIVLAGATTSAVTDDTVIKLLGTYNLALSTLASNVVTIA